MSEHNHHSQGDQPAPAGSSPESASQRTTNGGLGEKSGVSPSEEAPGRTTTKPHSTDRPPKQIGPYRILEPLGEGGMGVVYLAQQTEPVKRRVALKIIKPGMDSKAVLARFMAERQALAMMDHPSVARVLDAGVTDAGAPYFAMELVKGVPITEHCDRHKLSIGQRLELFMTVCHAVQHAHQKGIIHRDLKPSNILVEYADEKSIPKIIDFGVAKALNQRLTEATVFTQQGELIGTPEYMSPEQAEMSAQDVDTRSDIYSLGVLLYELLTGALPFDVKTLRQAGLGEIQRIIREVDPPKPSTRLSSLGDQSGTNARNRRLDLRSLTKGLRGDLDWIVMKALEKDRERRYETANGLAADIQRHLTDEPVLAGPPSATYGMKKFVRRNRGGVIAASIVLVVLLAGITGTSVGVVRANRALADAVAARASEAEQRQVAEQSRAESEQQRRIAEDEAKHARVEAAKSQRIAAFTQEILAGVDPAVSQGLDTTLIKKILDMASEKVGAKLADEPVVEASIRNTIGITYQAIGLYPQAELHLRKALEIHRLALDDDHPDTLESLNNMGALLHVMGKLDEALPYYRESLEGLRRVLGDDHPDTLASISNMGVLLYAIGKLDEALSYYRESLEGLRRVLGDDHPTTLTSISNMGALLYAIDKLDEALPYFQESLEGKRRILGDSHPTTLTSISNMGALLHKMGKIDEALPYLQESLEGKRRVLSDDHPEMLRSINNMGVLLQSQGKFTEAEPYYREALERYRRILGDDHPDTLASITNMASMLNELTRHDEALKLMQDGEVAARQVWTGDNARLLGNYLTKLGVSQAGVGQHTEAESTLLEAHKLLAAGFGEQSQRTIKAAQALIVLYTAWDKDEPGQGYDANADEWRERLAPEAPEETEPADSDGNESKTPDE